MPNSLIFVGFHPTYLLAVCEAMNIKVSSLIKEVENNLPEKISLIEK